MHESFATWKSIQQNWFSCTDICLLRNVLSMVTFLFWPFIRYKWLRGQCETVGKSICIHLSLLSAVESANYFSAGLKALPLCWVAKRARLAEPGTPAEWPTIRTDKGWMTDKEKADWDGWQKVTRSKEWRLEYYVKRRQPIESGHICSYGDPSIPTPLCAWLCKRWVKKLHIWNTTRIGCDWFSESGGGGGTELTWGSGLLIERWKTDREWEGTADVDGWIDRQMKQNEFEQQRQTVPLNWARDAPRKGFTSLSDVPPPLWSHVGFADTSSKKQLPCVRCLSLFR